MIIQAKNLTNNFYQDLNLLEKISILIFPKCKLIHVVHELIGKRISLGLASLQAEKTFFNQVHQVNK